MNLSATDVKILQLLQKDASLTAAEIAPVFFNPVVITTGTTANDIMNACRLLHAKSHRELEVGLWRHHAQGAPFLRLFPKHGRVVEEEHTRHQISLRCEGG